jgi:hypothetical protein
LRIAAETGDTIFLMARSGSNAVTVDRQEGTYMIASLTNNIGGQIPLGVGPAGEAILAFLPPDEIDAVLSVNANAYTAFNGLAASEVKTALPLIRERGYAIDEGRLVEGISALAVPINSSGPLTTVDVSTDLNCAVNHSGDADGEFFGNTACGTLLASGGTLYGPADIPAGDSASPRTAFTPVSQSAVTGSGTGADPFTVVTAVSLGTSPLRITETDSYVTGEESYRTDVTVRNIGDLAASAILYRAGDCFLQNSDSGFGSADASVGAVSCVVDDGGLPGTRIEQWFPLSAGSHYIEDFFDNVWAAIGTQTPFTDSCNQCANSVDNGAGLSWNLTIPPGGSVTRSHLTVFSPLGRVPLSKLARGSMPAPLHLTSSFLRMPCLVGAPVSPRGSISSWS